MQLQVICVCADLVVKKRLSRRSRLTQTPRRRAPKLISQKQFNAVEIELVLHSLANAAHTFQITTVGGAIMFLSTIGVAYYRIQA
jgi:hypothetical protein